MLCGIGGTINFFQATGTVRLQRMVASVEPLSNPYTTTPATGGCVYVKPGQSSPLTVHVYNTGNVALHVFRTAGALPTGCSIGVPPGTAQNAAVPVFRLEPGDSGTFETKVKLAADAPVNEHGIAGEFDLLVFGYDNEQGTGTASGGVLHFAVATAAVPVVDQRQTLITLVGESALMAPVGAGLALSQFVVPSGGKLAGIRLPICKLGEATGNLILEVRGRFDDATPLATVNIPAARLPLVLPLDPAQWWSTEFITNQSDGITVPAAGCAISLRVPDGSADRFGWGIHVAKQDAYPNGAFAFRFGTGRVWETGQFHLLNWDMAFETLTVDARRRPAPRTVRPPKKSTTTATTREQSSTAVPVGRMSFVSLLGIAGWPKVETLPVPLAVAKRGTLELSAEGTSAALNPAIKARFELTATHFPSGQTDHDDKTASGVASVHLGSKLRVIYTYGTGTRIPEVTAILNVSAQAILPIPLIAQGVVRFPVVTDQVSVKAGRRP